MAEDDYWSGQQRQALARPRRTSGAQRGADGQRRAGARIRAAVVALLVLVVMVGVVAAAFQLRKHTTHSTGNKTTTSKPVRPSVALLTPVSAHGFDPYNLKDTGKENDQSAAAAIDGSPATAWTSQYYFSPKFGGLKPGSGLILDMGNPVRLTSVRIQFGTIPGASVRIEIGDSNTYAPSTVRAMTTVAKAGDVSGLRTFPVHEQRHRPVRADLVHQAAADGVRATITWLRSSTSSCRARAEAGVRVGTHRGVASAAGPGNRGGARRKAVPRRPAAA